MKAKHLKGRAKQRQSEHSTANYSALGLVGGFLLCSVVMVLWNHGALLTFATITTVFLKPSTLASAVTTGPSSSSSLFSPLQRASRSTTTSPRAVFRVLQVQVVHRHGDRTPITPMKNESYWAATLPHPDLIAKVAASTNVCREDGAAANTHVARGRGPFGQLTQLGLLQMVDLGRMLREQLQAHVAEERAQDDHGPVFLNNGCLFSPKNPIRPSDVKVVSTDFPRTILSVQGTLIGLFPDEVNNHEPIDIDVKHTSIMIPDPQPRRSTEQVELEQALSNREHLKAKAAEMLPLAVKTTASLQLLLGDGANDISFGIGEEKTPTENTAKPLAWAQLAEITKCLAVRDLLPDTISIEDQEAIGAHTAWKWFENLRHPRLAFLAMNPMVTTMVKAMHSKLAAPSQEPSVIIYSAHDSTLIGLICAFRLEQPSVWPEYGSYLKLELLEATADTGEKNLLVRFSLNGGVLRSEWVEGESLEVIPLERLTENIKLDGSDCK